MQKGSPHYVGHRQRLRERFLKSGLGSFHDYEVVELLLTLAIPRGDVKQPAKDLIKRFKNLRGILDAPVDELRAVSGIGVVTPVALQIIKAAAALYLQQSGEDRDSLLDRSHLREFWRFRLGRLQNEVFEVAYLDSAYRLLRDGVERLEEGTVDRAVVYPRRVVEAALKRGASTIVLAHNHPNGNVAPSEHDKTLTRAIAGVRGYIDKITEELIDPDRLVSSGDAFLSAIGAACQRYERALFEASRVDFAHLQRLVYDLLDDPETANAVIGGHRYVLVDEYQDTNYIQEQLLLKLVGSSRNLCVVGDEDQSLYRFRGATVRNILEFPQRLTDCATVKLTTNYRSHRAVVERYDRWMASADWSNPNGVSFRYDKTIEADRKGKHPEYPSVISIWGNDRRDEAGRFADFVEFLKRSDVIEDYNQVALLLHSVREEHSGPYLAALQAKGIPAFCPRARGFFETPEIGYLVACYAVLFGWHGEERGPVGGAVANLADYVDGSIVQLGQRFGAPHPLAETLQQWIGQIAALREAKRLTCVRPTISTTCSRWSHSNAASATRTPPVTSPSFPNS